MRKFIGASLFSATFATGAQTSDCKLQATPRAAVEANTFMMIPIRQAVVSSTVASARRYVRENCRRPRLPLSTRLNCAKLARCRTGDCRAEFGDHGTAFVVGDGAHLVTAWHVPFISHETALTFLEGPLSQFAEDLRQQSYANLVPEFLLADRDERIIYDSRKSPATYLTIGDPLSTLYSRQGIKDGQSYGYFENSGDDYAVINLSHSLGQGLAMAEHAETSGCTYAAGFAFDGRKSSFAILSGHQVTAREIKSRQSQLIDFLLQPLPLPREDIEALDIKAQIEMLGYTPEEAAAQLKKFGLEKVRAAMKILLDAQARHARDFANEADARSIFVNNEIMSGMSGGPMLDGRGEVIGIINDAVLLSTGRRGMYRSVGGAAVLLSKIRKNYLGGPVLIR